MRYRGTSLFVLMFLCGEVTAQQQVPGVAKAVPVDGAIVGDKAKVKAQKSVSLNRQFIVKGESLSLNKSVSSLCDELAIGVQKLLGEKQRNEGSYSINVTLYSKGDAPKKNLFKNTVAQLEGGGYRIDLLVDIREQIDKSVLESGVMQAIIIERALQSNPDLNGDGARIEVPRWVSDGLLGAIKWKEGNRNRGMYEVLNRKPELFLVERLFITTQAEIEGMGETLGALYRASATAMMMSIIRQSENGDGLKNMLGEVAIFEGEMTELLRKNIPSMNIGTKGLIKLWNLQLAEMAAPRISDTRTIIKTEEDLQDILFFSLIGEDRLERRVAIEDFDVLLTMEQKERTNTVLFLNQKLVQLGYRAHPDYHPILVEYGLILTEISRREVEGISLKLRNLAAARVQLLERGKRARDVLDWYRISQSRGLSGDFSGYQKLLEQMKREETIEQRNAVSDYVNKMEGLMTR